MEPEVRSLETGVKVARIRLATSERIFNRQTNESTEHTEWHTVTLWRSLAEVVDKYVHKGSQLYIEGRLRSREWEQDGQKRYATEVQADEVSFVAPAGTPGAPVAGGNAPYTPEAYGTPSFGTSSAGFEEIPNDESLPF